jgi:serine/threonine protein kinase
VPVVDCPALALGRRTDPRPPVLMRPGGNAILIGAMSVSPSPGLLTALARRFTVARELGRGGMGTVLLAHDTSLDRDVAIKILTPEISEALGSERFTREIHLTARLVHPNIVPLFDSGELAGCLYYVMPYIDGHTLRERLDREGPLPVAEVVRLMGDLAEALAYAHALGTVHRDLKPENVFWYRGRAMLADFGVALPILGLQESRRITQTGLVVGSLPYLSPEQAGGSEGRIDGRADLYGLGCLAFELLSGRPPFEAPTPMALLAAHLTAPIPSVRARRAEVPSGLDRLIIRLMAKEPGDRPATAAAVLEILRRTERPTPAGRTRTSQPDQRLPGPDLPPEALEYYQKGRSVYVASMQGGPGTRDKLAIARVYFEKALALVPGNPHLLVGLSDVIHVMGIRGFADFAESDRRARDLRLQALAQDDKFGEVHTSIGVTFLYWDDEFDIGGSELARGAELAPHNAEGHRLYGAWLKIAGRPEEALEQMRASVELAPDAPFMHVGLADVLMSLGRYDEAIGPLREALRLAPRYAAALERLEMSCHRAGRHEEALDARRVLLGVRDQIDRLKALDERAARDGWLAAREQDLRRELADLLAEAEREDPFLDRQGSRQLCDRLLIVLAELGEWGQAMDWVERSYYRRPGRLRRLLRDLPYDSRGLASDPRYARLLRTAGLLDLLTP